MELPEKQKIFVQNYVIEWNATKSYIAAYPDCKTYEAAKSAASRLLTNVNVQSYIEEVQKDLSKLCGVSAARNVLELKKIAYSNLSNFKDNWVTEKDFNKLTADEKAALSEIQHVEKVFDGGTETVVKFKLHDKQKAIEIMNRMLGYNAAERSKIDIDVTDIRSESEREARIAELYAKLESGKNNPE